MENARKILGKFYEKLLQKRNRFCIMVVQSGVRIHFKDIKWGKSKDFQPNFQKGVTNDERNRRTLNVGKRYVFEHV